MRTGTYCPPSRASPCESVRMGSLTTGWAGGEDSETFENRSRRQQLVRAGRLVLGLVTLEAVDDQHAWILQNRWLHRTTDGGQTWQAFDLASYGAKDVDFVDRDHGWLVFDSQVLTTVDGGLTWTPQTAPSATYLDVDFVDDLHGWIMAKVDRQRVWLKTDDGGLTWSQVGGTREAGWAARWILPT